MSEQPTEQLSTKGRTGAVVPIAVVGVITVLIVALFVGLEISRTSRSHEYEPFYWQYGVTLAAFAGVCVVDILFERRFRLWARCTFEGKLFYVGCLYAAFSLASCFVHLFLGMAFEGYRITPQSDVNHIILLWTLALAILLGGAAALVLGRAMRYVVARAKKQRDGLDP